MVRSRFFLPVLASFASLLCGDAFGTPSETQRYPFDPACAWGRLADGRGLIVRCLTREESERLSKALAPSASVVAPKAGSTVGVAATTPPAVSRPPATNQQEASALPAPLTTAATAQPTSPAPISPSSAGGAASSVTVVGGGPSVTANAEPLQAELVSVTADDGELPLAKKKLSAPLDRYAKCVADFGGLSAAIGQVDVRFLVRERGRAEGTSVGRYQGMSEAAANCIAQVVDRRPTGVPEAPVVGATATIRVRKRSVK